jgi:hypothetical protein
MYIDELVDLQHIQMYKKQGLDTIVTLLEEHRLTYALYSCTALTWSFIGTAGSLILYIVAMISSRSTESNCLLRWYLVLASMDPDVDKFLRFMRAYRSLNKSKYTLAGDLASIQLRICGKCSNKSLIVESAQTRAQDEESTEIAWCMKCER